MDAMAMQGKSETFDTYLGHTFIFRDQHQRFLARRVSERVFL